MATALLCLHRRATAGIVGKPPLVASPSPCLRGLDQRSSSIAGTTLYKEDLTVEEDGCSVLRSATRSAHNAPCNVLTVSALATCPLLSPKTILAGTTLPDFFFAAGSVPHILVRCRKLPFSTRTC